MSPVIVAMRNGVRSCNAVCLITRPDPFLCGVGNVTNFSQKALKIRGKVLPGGEKIMLPRPQLIAGVEIVRSSSKSTVSAEHPPLNYLNEWLDITEKSHPGVPSFRHQLIVRKTSALSQAAKDELFEYIDHAHEGARQSLRAPLGTSLHPLHYGKKVDPAFGYPERCHSSALRGFFGEILAGIVAEYYLTDEKTCWEVPVYLFKHHIVAFQQLELMKQIDEWGTQIVGRTGDDGLAFSWNDNDDQITGWLACEAKCTGSHSSTLISDNYKKLSSGAKRPVDLLRIIPALEDYAQDGYQRVWIDAIRQFYFETQRVRHVNRSDLSVYVCAKKPTRKSTWTDRDLPHPDYTGRRNLFCIEIHIPDLEEIINEMYGNMGESV